MRGATRELRRRLVGSPEPEAGKRRRPPRRAAVVPDLDAMRRLLGAVLEADADDHLAGVAALQSEGILVLAVDVPVPLDLEEGPQLLVGQRQGRLGAEVDRGDALAVAADGVAVVAV